MACKRGADEAQPWAMGFHRVSISKVGIQRKKLVLKDTCGGADAGTQSSNFKRVGLVYSPNLTATIPALCPEGECLTVKWVEVTSGCTYLIRTATRATVSTIMTTPKNMYRMINSVWKKNNQAYIFYTNTYINSLNIRLKKQTQTLCDRCSAFTFPKQWNL